MADRSSGALWLGGTIARSALPALAYVITEAGGGHDYGMQFETDEEVVETLKLAAGDAKPFAMFATELAGGTFEGMEAKLLELGLPFVASWDAHYSYSAGARAWRPGMEKVDELPADNDGRALVDAHTLSMAYVASDVGGLIARLNRFDPDAMPALVIVEDGEA